MTGGRAHGFAREIVGGKTVDPGERTGSIWMSRRWRCRCTHARRWCRRCQSRQSSGDDPPVRGWSSTLTGRGLRVSLPFHWHCSRHGHGRPSRSRRGSCGARTWPAGHRRVPSGWRGKSVPVKRPADPWTSRWQGEQTPGQEGRSEAWVRARVGAGGQGHTWWCATVSGASWWPHASRIFQVHWLMMCQASCPQAEWLHQRSGSCSMSSSSSAVSQAPRCRERDTTSEAGKARGGRFGCHPEWWIFRTLRAPFPGFQNLLTQERKAASAIHGALTILQRVDFALDGSVPVGKRECRVQSSPLFLSPLSKRNQIADPAHLAVPEPD